MHAFVDGIPHQLSCNPRTHAAISPMLLAASVFFAHELAVGSRGSQFRSRATAAVTDASQICVKPTTLSRSRAVGAEG